jgi:N-acetylmuramoyl-L-alanine amidase
MKMGKHMRSVAIFLAVLLLLASLPIKGARAAAVLEVGSTGANVTKVQKKLIQFGYMSGEADGRYGEKTRDAVKWFQRKNGLTADGKVGKATAAALGVTLSGSSSSSGRSVAAVSDSIISADHRLLSKLVYAEARGETYKGKVAVAAVVLNRVSSASFPNTISGVIYQNGAFTCVSNGSINNTPDSECIRAAREALNGWDPTGGCLYYYNPRTAVDDWIRTRTIKTVIGNHSFCM